MADPQTQPTIHACAIALGRCGILIEGASGAGKTRLADALIEDWSKAGDFARWVADDRVMLDGEGITCTASAPSTIAGQKEHAFLGILNTPHLPSVKLDLVVRLVPTDPLERIPVTAHKVYDLPLLFAPQRTLTVSVPLVKARIRQLT